MASSLKGHTCSLPLRKRELFLRLLRHETNSISHCDSGGRQKVGAWKVGWVPSEKENFLVQKGLGHVEDCLGWGSLAWTFQIHLAFQRRESRYFHTWMSLQEWFWADKLRSEGLSSSPGQEPLGMVALFQSVSCFWNSSWGNFKEEKKNLNCVELLYLLLFFFEKINV